MSKSTIGEKITAAFADLTTIGRYKIIRKLGQGASAVVYLGLDPYIKRHVAIKVSQPASERDLERFFTEAQNAGSLNHQNLVAIYDVGMHDRYCYLTMEYVDGGTLEKCCLRDSLLPVNKAVEVIFSICNAIDYAHSKGIIHRDVKPSNIMLDKSGTPKITDFGIAQMTKETSEIGVWGTPSYMSPEQFKDETIGSYSDVFSLGCVLYELLTGEIAFPGDNNFAVMYKVTTEEPPPITELRPELPEILNEIVKKALKKDATERYQTCMDMGYDLRVALRGLADTFPDEKIKDTIDYVHHAPFFQNFTREQVKDLLAAGKITKFPSGRVIVAEGDIDDTFYIILNGNTRIMKNGEQVAFLGTGECFGEMAYISGQARTASVVADTDCILIKFSATLMDKSSRDIQLLFYKNFAKTLVHRFSAKS